MDNSSIIVNSSLPTTNFFIFCDQQYHFNRVIFDQFSPYFVSKNIHLLPNTGINLLEDTENNLHLDDASIRDFVNHCQNQAITITINNVLPIQMLAKKYMVQSLITQTEAFIRQHPNELLVSFLSINHDHQVDTSQYEDIISDNLPNYIQDDQLLSIPISSLYRIMTKYQLKNKDENNNDQQPPEIIEFLFKCLDKFGRNASPLFEHVDFGEKDRSIINRLLINYSNKFNFNFINSNHLKTIYELSSEILQREENIIRIQHEIEAENAKIKQQIAMIDQLKNQNDELLKKPITIHYMGGNDYKGIISFIGDDVHLSNGGYPDPNYLISNIKIDDKSYFYNYYNRNTNRYDLEIVKDEKESYIEFDFGEKKIDLFSYFIRSNGCGSGWFHPKSWMMMGSKENGNDAKWEILDIRFNESALNGELHGFHFICQQSKYGNIHNRFRYIRFYQKDSWNDTNKYNIYLAYFELYGDVYD